MQKVGDVAKDIINYLTMYNSGTIHDIAIANMRSEATVRSAMAFLRKINWVNVIGLERAISTGGTARKIWALTDDYKYYVTILIDRDENKKSQPKE